MNHRSCCLYSVFRSSARRVVYLEKQTRGCELWRCEGGGGKGNMQNCVSVVKQESEEGVSFRRKREEEAEEEALRTMGL
ncbi:hypothetical protein E2C01_082411 [Portunus trituberculatus]|uniref:Uncharacterized protein n=1 Tax=Portunus trituberculatus TaxID=210409 RepID=A0A5B7J0S9_PORTR|nr:hypothetical protein [Portunus trituberculatus]